MLTNKQKKAGLTDLIEMTTPDWLSEEVYQDYMNNFDYYKTSFPSITPLCEAKFEYDGTKLYVY